MRIGKDHCVLDRVVVIHRTGRTHPALLHFLAERPQGCRPKSLHFLMCPNVPQNVLAAFNGPRAPRAPRKN